MVNFTVDEIRALMDYPSNIRNISIIAHVDHGKSTLTDSLICAAGIIAQKQAGDARFMDTREDEQARTITIKATAVSLFFEMPNSDLNVFTGFVGDDDSDEEKEETEKAGKKGKKGAKEAAAPVDAKAGKKGAKDAAKAGKKGAKDAAKAGKKGKKGAKAVMSEGAEEGGADANAKTPEAQDAPSEETKTALQKWVIPPSDYVPKQAPLEPVLSAIQGQTPFLINLIDSPGHVDFSSEVTAALRVTDGALVVVDCIEGVCVQTETVLRQAIAERIKPILFVNKLDRVFLELHMDHEAAYQTFARAVESVNVVIATYRDDALGNVEVYPQRGTVGFGSGLMCWGFTLLKFARIYATKFGVSAEKMMKKLWGDNYFNPKTKKWTSKSYTKSGDRLQRGFCEFVIKPIDTIINSMIEEKTEEYTTLLGKLGVKIPKEAAELTGKPLCKLVMQTWLPAAESLLMMIVNHLPSPVVAQRYRCDNLYSGPAEDDAAKAIRCCDSAGPLMIYISKMVPTSEKGRFYAFGRVFSGTVSTGQDVRIMGPDYLPGTKKDLFQKKVQRVILMMGRYTEQMSSAPCGNLIGLVGIDSYLLKAGTISTYEYAWNFHTMKYSVSPVVRVSVDVKNASDLPKLMEGLKRLAKSDPLVLCYTSPSGEHIVAGAGELHLEICIKDLRDDFMKGAPIVEGKPVVNFCETVTTKSELVVVSKSPNKHNRIYLTAQPMGEKLTNAIDKKDITWDMDMKVRARILADDYGMDVNAARKIWTFGCPPDGIPNILTDNTKACAYLHEIKDSCVGAFIQATAAGILCDEALRGCRFDLEDCVLHADAIHRGAGQIMPPMKRAIAGCQIRSGPALMEPMYMVDITVPQPALNGVYSTLNARRGIIEGKEDRVGTPLTQIKAFLPVLESFGFTQLLRQNTSGQAFPQMIFSHYQLVQGSPYTEGSQCNTIALEVRQRKGLNAGMPDFADYYDRI